MILKLIYIYFKTLSFISPSLAAKNAFKVFQKVRKKDIRQREEVYYLEATKRTLPFEKENLNVYEFGTENKDLVILMHGWDSNAGCMYSFVNELLEQKKRIISINLPGHADYKSYSTNFFECKNAFKVLLGNLPEHNNLSIIAHSFGSGISTYALTEIDIKVDNLIFLTSPNVIEDIFIDFKKMIGLNQKAYNKLNVKASEILNEPLENLIMENKLKKFKFNHLYLIHDKFDKIIPYSNSVSMNKAIDNSTLIPYENVGHYRMLWNKEIVNNVMECLNK